jgi:hypothetical protein
VTRLLKAIRREARCTYEQGRPIIVTLEPGDMISVRQKGCRTVWRTTLGACLHMAIKAEVRAAQAEKSARKKVRIARG